MCVRPSGHPTPYGVPHAARRDLCDETITEIQAEWKEGDDLGAQAGARPAGPFSLPSLSDAHGWQGLEEERAIYLRAVPNATDDQLQTGVATWARLSEELGPRSLEDQARLVLAFPFYTQELVLAGGAGEATRRVTDRYPSVSLEEIADTIGAAGGEIRTGTSGYLSRRASAAEARAAIRDMKGASLAAVERLYSEDSAAAAAYDDALRAAAREVRTEKASKAELAAVARLTGAPLPRDVRSWSQVKKAGIKDALEEHLETEINPNRGPAPDLTVGQRHRNMAGAGPRRG